MILTRQRRVRRVKFCEDMKNLNCFFLRYKYNVPRQLVEIISSEIEKVPGVLSLEDNVSMLEIVCRKIYLKFISILLKTKLLIGQLCK